MTLHLIRHTSPHIPEGTCYGRLDLDVSDTFAVEARQVQSKLENTYSNVFVSPLRRCLKLAEYLNLSFEVDCRIQEMNFGDWEGVSWSDIDPAQINAWADDIVGYRVPGGERFQDVLDRVGEFLSELPGGDNLLITHSGVIKACWALRGGLSVEVAAKRSMGFGDYLSIP